jgi:hypothetical protein
MRRRAEAEAVACRPRVEVDLAPEVATAVPVVPVDLPVAVTSAAVDPVDPVAPADLVDLVDRTSAAVALAGLVVRTSTTVAQVVPVDLVARVDLVVLVTSADLAVRVGLVAQVTSVVPGVLATSTEAAPTTSDHGPITPSAASAANRGAMEPHLGAGALRPAQAGAGRSLHPEGSGTRAR